MAHEPNLHSAPAEPAPAAAEITISPPGDASRLRDLTPQQWKSGLAAWLGWLFDGLDMHIYTLVAMPFVAELLGPSADDESVRWHSSLIQASFLVGWALGGAFFGRLGDLLGRSRALVLTILTYTLFTGLGFFAQAWWHLLIFRFLAALGIGGEWAVGASLLSETWPKSWRPWLSAVLQTAVNIGNLMAVVAGFALAASDAPKRCYFLVGLAPALIVVWIRKAVPEPEIWHAAHDRARDHAPGVADLFRGSLRKITLLTMLVCALSLTGHWVFVFWSIQHLGHLGTVAGWSAAEVQQYKNFGLGVAMVSAIAGNFFAAGVARKLGYRVGIVCMCVLYGVSLFAGYSVPRPPEQMWLFLIPCGVSQGIFGLFTMYMPPLFPPLLRTTGAGFCYNIGRLAAAAGTVYFGLFSYLFDPRLAIFYAGFLFAPAALVALLLPEPPDV